ncbi:sensor histidine kinase [Pedobacter frigoris]|uniref:histidine kinase n=1 Tax=Pedobacter frigoris TaxID=2571272 RepID=A0A4U1CFU2_9SPHI|nr:HAMP domain-containing sensor histidine kinase [Pedobacter frigoris]TKC06052.1 HAMP domain-containing histidine kinase [Pedobacter frigoris]
MKLSSKLVYFITGSKLIVVLLFVLSLPFLVQQIASEYTNYSLREQRKEVISVIQKKGIDYYLQGDDSYGSYTLLKEEYIALEPDTNGQRLDTIKNAQRIIEQDTLNYRVLNYSFKMNGKPYLLEIGKATASINQYNKPLQRIALYVLMGLIAITILIDLVFTRILIRPLGKIIASKLINRKFPFKDHAKPVKTSTDDFKYLDESLIVLMDQINEDFEKEREFTANASHELMTPISILQNKMENMLAEDQLTDELALRIVEMMKTLDRLKKISASLLFISRIENEQFAKTAGVVPREVIAEVIKEISHRLEDKNIKLEVRFSDGIFSFKANYDLIFQLFYNVINNAIKYNKENGSIVISDESDAKGNYKVLIKDTGIGIEQSELGFIFDRFRKTNLTENVGYGLGLSIVKSIAEYHGIKMQVTSVIREGTCFTIVFSK